MKLSIVATLYCSAAYVAEFVRRAKESAAALVDNDYEIILVNDGSPDNSLAIAVALSESDSHITVIDLSRNFGHHKAMMTGLSHSRGERVFLIDSDLEEAPEWLTEFDTEYQTSGSDVVFGVQEQRKGGWFERRSGSLFYSFYKRLTGIELPRNMVTARLMSRRYVEALIQHRDQEVFIAGLWLITGFKQSEIGVLKIDSSPSTYTLRKKMSVFVNSVTSFSSTPLKGIFYIGMAISISAFTYILYLVFTKFFVSEPLPGWTSVMASVWLLGGMIISFLGIIGIYLAKIFSETKDRPYTIVRQIYGNKTK